MLKSLTNHSQIYASWEVVHKLMMIHLFWLLLFSYFFFSVLLGLHAQIIIK